MKHCKTEKKVQQKQDILILHAMFLNNEKGSFCYRVGKNNVINLSEISCTCKGM